MRSLHVSIVLGLAAVVVAPSLLACDMASGERKQLVFLEWDDRSIEHWAVESSEIHRVELPNGFELGLKIEPAPAEMHAERWAKGQHSPEMLKVSLFDLGGATPKCLAPKSLDPVEC